MFAGVPPVIVDRLAGSALVQDLPRATRVFQQGADAEYMHILLDGQVALIGHRPDGEQCIVEMMGPGDVFVAAAVLLEQPYLVSARTGEPCRLAMIPAGVFRRAVASEPLLTAAVMHQLATYWRLLVTQIKDLKLRTAPERLGSYLLRMAGNENSGRASVAIGDSYRTLAMRLAMTPESLSRAFKSLESLGVRTNGRDIEIADVAKLREFAQFDSLR